MNKTLFLTLLLCLASLNGLADSMSSKQKAPNYIVTLSGGPIRSSKGQSQTVFTEPNLFTTFIADRGNKTLGGGELFVGLQGSFNQVFFCHFGLGIASSSQAYLSGKVQSSDNPSFDNVFYNYKLLHTNIAAKGKLLAGANFWIQPYVSTSVGVGIDYSHDFSIKSASTEQSTIPELPSRNTLSSTYSVGAGLQKALNKNWSFGLGYEFANWGGSHLAKPNHPQDKGLVLNHFYTHQLQISLSYNLHYL